MSFDQGEKDFIGWEFVFTEGGQILHEPVGWLGEGLLLMEGEDVVGGGGEVEISLLADLLEAVKEDEFLATIRLFRGRLALLLLHTDIINDGIKQDWIQNVCDKTEQK